ncbi:hypothetical protein NUW58_g6946 [Xylaria curta]|uniref:Uncharacterized protein n=1 Tax=Xylaria curta TaxID=42375 RepID=A0ACC1NPX8_9PEZI|nr:hypothetical protein NUW58_g6946 [Xylaria curta]
MPSVKPKLAQLTTPVTATFPSELSALSASARTPLSAIPAFIKEEFPGSARTPISPPTAYMDFLKAVSVQSPVIPTKRSASGSSTPEEDSAQDSAPSTASSLQTDCSSHVCTTYERDILPGLEHATVSSSVHDGVTFERYNTIAIQYTVNCRAHKATSKSVRHIREVVTRTVTYTPRMSPAPKGKRRKTHANCQKLTAAAATATATATTEISPPPTSS